MAQTLTLQFQSMLPASREQVWRWITSVDGIRTEMHPILRMTVPKKICQLTEGEVKLGAPLFRSFILLFGLLPIDYSDLTLIQLDHGCGFVEQSPMASMALWRHERRIGHDPTVLDAVILMDRLTFCPRGAGSLVGWFVKRFFEHRHAVLRRHFGTY